jgi:glycosyltransferase involved in cell wall biosynthesis
MKIIFIHQNFPGQFKHLAPALAAGGDEVIGLGINSPAYETAGVRVILHRPQLANAEAFKDAPIDLRETLAKTTRGHSVARCLTGLKEEGFVPNVIVAHSGWGEAYFIKDVFPRVPLIVYAEYFYGTEGGDAYFDPEFTQSSLEGLERLRLKNTHLLHALVAADRGLAPTCFQRDRHPELLREKISVIHDGIDSERLKPNPGARVRLKRAGLDLGSADEVVTFVARELEPYRGYHLFMRALPELLTLRPRLQVVVVGGHGVSYGAAPPAGTTWKDIFFNEVADRIDRKRVHFVGRLPHDGLTQLMQVATVHLYLTYPFVLSWSLMEAMSIGCLIVASRTAPVEEVIEHGRTGLLVDFFDAHQIALTVADALQRRAELIPLRRAARQHIVQEYDLQTRCLPAQVELLRRIGEAAIS